MGHRLGLATRTQISVCKSPFPSAGTAVALFCVKTVQQRPLLLSGNTAWHDDDDERCCQQTMYNDDLCMYEAADNKDSDNDDDDG